MFKNAREKVKEDGYQFKKGYSRSNSSSSGSEASSEKRVKRKHTNAEERQKAISNIKTLLESTDDHIRIKKLRIEKLKACSDYRQCDSITNEVTRLLKQKQEYESQLAVLQRKESQSKWHKKKSKKSTESKAPSVQGIATILNKVNDTCTSPCNAANTPHSCTATETEGTLVTEIITIDSSTTTGAGNLVGTTDNSNDSATPINASDSADSADTVILDDSPDLFL